MPKTGRLNPDTDTMRKNFCKQRSRIARILQNPKLKQTSLHTFHHWKATIEYHGTKKRDRESQSAQARNLAEQNKLIEASLIPCYGEKDEVAIYRKRK